MQLRTAKEHYLIIETAKLAEELGLTDIYYMYRHRAASLEEHERHRRELAARYDEWLIAMQYE